MKRRLISLAIASVLVITTMTGCVKVVKNGEEGKYTGKVEFNAGESVSGLWESAQANIEENALDIVAMLTEANGDLKSLASKYAEGKTGSISYAVKGSGTVLEVNQEKKAGYMTVKLDGYDGAEIIKLQIGSIYKGSSTRDALDIIDFGDYTNQEEWAAISKELHFMIDSNVIQPANPAELTGKSIDFIGTFTENGNEELLITPIKLTVK